ncbi:MAG: hypothetical protein JWL80_522 [Parcubacteria group bacterium]|nr:hypothetical protein [Parcubacteria group bacterium]
MITQNTDALLKELNLGDLQGKEREDVLATLEKRFDDVILSTVLDHLSPEQYEAFKAALKSENPEEGIAAVTAGVPGLAEIIEMRLSQEYKLMKEVMS